MEGEVESLDEAGIVRIVRDRADVPVDLVAPGMVHRFRLGEPPLLFHLSDG